MVPRHPLRLLAVQGFLVVSATTQGICSPVDTAVNCLDAGELGSVGDLVL